MNPSSNDLIKNGWSDYKCLIGISENLKTYERFIDDFHPFVHEVELQQINGRDIIVFKFLSKFSPEEFNNDIKEKNYERIKVFNSETPELTLDNVLDKINAEGMNSLNIRESSFINSLEFYTK
jgi:pentose-5-phosphate-3-epimerase